MELMLNCLRSFTIKKNLKGRTKSVLDKMLVIAWAGTKEKKKGEMYLNDLGRRASCLGQIKLNAEGQGSAKKLHNPLSLGGAGKNAEAKRFTESLTESFQSIWKDSFLRG